MSEFRVGLDVGATKTLGVALDAQGVVMAEERAATEPGPVGVVDSAVRVVTALRRTTGDPLTGPLGVGVPGLVDADRGSIVQAVNLGLDGEPLAVGDLLADRLGVPVRVENDVNVGALGASARCGVDDLAYLAIGTGLAAGLVLGGRLRRGVAGAAGEIGHVPVDPEGAWCRCGQRGCLETVASGSALAAAWPVTTGSPAQAVFAAAGRGDPAAERVRDRFAGAVAEAVRLVALAVDPDVVVLGGGVADLGEPLRACVEVALRRQAASSAFLVSLDLASRVRVAGAGPVGAIGAALLGRDEAAVRP